MNSDLEQLLYLRGSISYLFALDEKRKKEIPELEKKLKTNKLKYQWLKSDREYTYNEARTLTKKYADYKKEMDRLDKERDKIYHPYSFWGFFRFCIKPILIWIIAILGLALGGALFILFSEEWMEISSWITPEYWTFKITGYSIKYGLYGLMFGVYCIAGVTALAIATAIIIVIIDYIYQLATKKYKKARGVYTTKIYKIAHEFTYPHETKYLDELPDEIEEKKRMEAVQKQIDDEILAAENEIKKTEQQIQFCITDLEQSHKKFKQTKFILKPDDYKYTDYLIYLIDSNRAANLPQAFQLLEAQIRHNELMSKLDSLEHSITASIKNLQGAIEANTSAIYSLQNTIREEAQATQELIKEGNKISSLQVEKLKDIDFNIKQLHVRYPTIRF